MRLFCWILENALIHCNKFVHLYIDMEIHPDTMCCSFYCCIIVNVHVREDLRVPIWKPHVAISSVSCHIVTYQEDMPMDMPAVLLIAEDTKWQTSLSHWLPCFPTANSPASLVSTLCPLEGTNFVWPTVTNWRTRLRLPEGATPTQSIWNYPSRENRPLCADLLIQRHGVALCVLRCCIFNSVLVSTYRSMCVFC